jgi:transposase
VLDVPPKLSAQVRVFATGNGRKTDPVDAHSVAIAALYSAGLVRVEVDDDLVVMGMLADPGGHSGNDSVSSAADSHPGIDSSDKPHPGLANTHPRTEVLAAS